MSFSSTSEHVGPDLADALETPEDGHVCVLVVEDDPASRQMILDYFRNNKICTLGASNRQEMFSHIDSARPNLIILDLRLGQEDGLDLLREIRSTSNVPVIIVTGQLCQEVERVVGLELGADDYLTKPFGLRELLARVRAVLRRANIRRAPEPESRPNHVRFGGWLLECKTRRLIDPDRKRVVLSKGEYALLLAFLDAPQRPLSREQLLEATRAQEDVFDRSIDVQILRLRRKLERDPNATRVIETERGVGYVLTVPVTRV